MFSVYQDLPWWRHIVLPAKVSTGNHEISCIRMKPFMRDNIHVCVQRQFICWLAVTVSLTSCDWNRSSRTSLSLGSSHRVNGALDLRESIGRYMELRITCQQHVNTYRSKSYTVSLFSYDIWLKVCSFRGPPSIIIIWPRVYIGTEASHTANYSGNCEIWHVCKYSDNLNGKQLRENCYWLFITTQSTRRELVMA